jgi:hypothetical protein
MTSPYDPTGKLDHREALNGTNNYKFLLFGVNMLDANYVFGSTSGWIDVKITQGAATLAAASLVATAALLL